MQGTRLRRVGAIAAVIGIALAVLFAVPSTASGPDVTIKGTTLSTYRFAPRTLTVKRGSTVTWGWHSNAPHNVTFRKLGKHSATGASGSYQLKFKHRGTFRYLCTIHGFRGKIVVN